jgi:hypothetical protein
MFVVRILKQLRMTFCAGMFFSVMFYIWNFLLWSSGQSFWLQIQRSQVQFPSLPDFLRSRGSGTGSTHRQVGGLERGPLSLVITTEELLEKRSSGSGLENRD